MTQLTRLVSSAKQRRTGTGKQRAKRQPRGTAIERQLARRRNRSAGPIHQSARGPAGRAAMHRDIVGKVLAGWMTIRGQAGRAAMHRDCQTAVPLLRFLYCGRVVGRFAARGFRTTLARLRRPKRCAPSEHPSGAPSGHPSGAPSGAKIWSRRTLERRACRTHRATHPLPVTRARSHQSRHAPQRRQSGRSLQCRPTCRCARALCPAGQRHPLAQSKTAHPVMPRSRPRQRGNWLCNQSPTR